MRVVPTRKFGWAGGDCASTDTASRRTSGTETPKTRRMTASKQEGPADPLQADRDYRLIPDNGMSSTPKRAVMRSRMIRRTCVVSGSIVHIFEKRTIDGFTAC